MFGSPHVAIRKLEMACGMSDSSSNFTNISGALLSTSVKNSKVCLHVTVLDLLVSNAYFQIALPAASMMCVFSLDFHPLTSMLVEKIHFSPKPSPIKQCLSRIFALVAAQANALDAH